MDLKKGDYYFFIDEDWKIQYDIFGFEDWHTLRQEIGNCFLTEQEAEKELSKMKARAKIRRFIEENGLEKGCWYPQVYTKQSSEGSFNYEFSEIITQNEYGLKNREDICRLISACSEELKIVFGIE